MISYEDISKEPMEDMPVVRLPIPTPINDAIEAYQVAHKERHPSLKKPNKKIVCHFCMCVGVNALNELTEKMIIEMTAKPSTALT